MQPSYQFPPISFPGSDLLPAHCQIDWIDLNRVPRVLLLLLFEIPLVYLAIGRLVQPSGKTEIGQFQVAVLVDQDIVGLDVPRHEARR